MLRLTISLFPDCPQLMPDWVSQLCHFWIGYLLFCLTHKYCDSSINVNQLTARTVYSMHFETLIPSDMNPEHDDVIKWKHFPRYWPFVRGIHRSPVNSPHKGQWRGAVVFTLICVWVNGCVNNREAGDLRLYCAHYGVTVMEAYKNTIIVMVYPIKSVFFFAEFCFDMFTT